MGWPAHHPISDAERIHDVEREQRDVRGLEHVAAGVEHEIRRLGIALVARLRALAEPRQQVVGQLQLRQRGDVAPKIAERVDAAPPPLRQLAGRLRHADARHRQQETRIDAIVARLDAFAAKQARIRPLARGFGTRAGAHDVDHAADDVGRRSLAEAGRRHAGAGFDALAATGAGIEHVVDTGGERSFECGGIHEAASAVFRCP